GGRRGQLLRTRLGAAHADRRLAADDRRHPDPGARALRPCLRHLLHGREGSVVRPHALALSPRARAAARRSLPARGGGDGGGDRGDVDLARIRLALRRTPGDGGGVADDRGHPDLLLLLPAVDSRSAPPLRWTMSAG